MTKDHLMSCSFTACERAFLLLGLGKRVLQIVAGARSLLHRGVKLDNGIRSREHPEKIGLDA